LQTKVKEERRHSYCYYGKLATVNAGRETNIPVTVIRGYRKAKLI